MSVWKTCGETGRNRAGINNNGTHGLVTVQASRWECGSESACISAQRGWGSQGTSVSSVMHVLLLVSWQTKYKRELTTPGSELLGQECSVEAMIGGQSFSLLINTGRWVTNPSDNETEKGNVMGDQNKFPLEVAESNLDAFCYHSDQGSHSISLLITW